MGAVAQLIVHHTASPAGTRVETVHDSHLGRGWPGIAYHFYIEEAGTVTWCGALETVRGHTDHTPTNRGSIGVCLAGDFTSSPPGVAQLVGLRRLIAWLETKLGLRLWVRPHRAVTATACPGGGWFDKMIAELPS